MYTIHTFYRRCTKACSRSVKFKISEQTRKEFHKFKKLKKLFCSWLVVELLFSM